jgi:DMSO/TMAO reductase YedYZ molybdopterin-dependent catalytic subunit
MTAAPLPEMAQNWNPRVDDLVQWPRDVRIADLQKMSQVKRVSVMQCAAKDRFLYAARQKVAAGQ